MLQSHNRIGCSCLLTQPLHYYQRFMGGHGTYKMVVLQSFIILPAFWNHLIEIVFTALLHPYWNIITNSFYLILVD